MSQQFRFIDRRPNMRWTEPTPRPAVRESEALAGRSTVRELFTARRLTLCSVVGRLARLAVCSSLLTRKPGKLRYTV